MVKGMESGHAYIAAGRSSDVEAVLFLLREWGIKTLANPDLHVRSYASFGIDEARALSERAALRAVGKGRVFVVSIDSITAEAQNALLKTLEEPPGGALFFFLHPAPATLLPTVRSRVQIIDLPQKRKHESTIFVKQFLQATPAKRVDLLKPLLEKGDDDKRDIGEILAFLSALEAELATHKSGGDGLHALYRARRYIGDRGALVKPLLEQVALLI